MENAVIRNSDEWNAIEFALQLRCRTSRVKLLQAWNVTKTESVSMFNRRTKNMPILESFIDTEGLDYYNSIQDVCTRGFEIGNSGFLVSFGNLSLPGFPLLQFNTNGLTVLDNKVGSLNADGKLMPSKYSTTSLNVPTLYPEKRIFEYFICDVGVGKALEVPDVLEAQRSRVSMPVEYDSYFLTNSGSTRLDSLTTFTTEEDPDKDLNFVKDDVHSKGVLPQNTFKHDYIIYDSSQILVRYLIQFECDYQAEELYALPLCDNCQNDVATIYCPSDTARICAKCDVLLHSNNKVVSRHIRVPLSESYRKMKCEERYHIIRLFCETAMPRAHTHCKIHPTKSYHLYCTVCHIPICQLCTADHIHNPCNDETGSTSFIPISTAYEAAVRDLSRTSNEIISARRNQLLEVLNDVEQIKKEVHDNCQTVAKSCYEKLERALRDIQTLANESLEIVLSEQTENKRQLNEIKWSEYFVEYMRSTLLPPDYLKAWLRHCRLCNELANNSHKLPQHEIFADITLESELNILLEDTKLHLNDGKHIINI